MNKKPVSWKIYLHNLAYFLVIYHAIIILHVESIPRRVPQRESFTKWFPASQSHAGKCTFYTNYIWIRFVEYHLYFVSQPGCCIQA